MHKINRQINCLNTLILYIKIGKKKCMHAFTNNSGYLHVHVFLLYCINDMSNKIYAKISRKQDKHYLKIKKIISPTVKKTNHDTINKPTIFKR